MVKLATARDNRLYGPRLGRNRAEYMNAGLYVFATILLLIGFGVHLSNAPRLGLVFVLIALCLIFIVNVHDLVAHLAGIDYCFSLMALDLQLMLVEFAVPFVQALGTILAFLGLLFLLIQRQREDRYEHLEKHALNMLIAGPALWVLGSIHNACQIYQRADGHVQILQQSVHTPFLMGSFLFLIGSILDRRDHSRSPGNIPSLGWDWIWFGIFGSVFFLIGGIANVVKVFKMQQIDGVRVEKLRGGAQERLIFAREGQVPLITEEHRISRRQRQAAAAEQADAALPGTSTKPVVAAAAPTPYKDVLVSEP